jgi:hypothetical protein
MRTRLMLIVIGVSLLLVGCGQVQSQDLGAEVGTPRASVTAIAAVSPTPPSSQQTPLTCEIVVGTIAGIPNIDDLTWASNAIVVGTVAKRLPTTPNPDATNSPMFTDYVVDVQNVYRGAKVDSIRIRRSGGNIPGGCSQPESGPTIQVGDRFLLFLIDPQTGTDAPTYFVTGEGQGYFRLNDKDQVTETNYTEFQDKLVGTVASRVAQVLAEPMTPGERIAGNYRVISKEQAPLGPDLPTKATPVP